MNEVKRGRVLLLDGQFMSSLSIARSLGQRGIEVVLASPEERPLASVSRYVASHSRYPDPTSDTEAFCQHIEALILKHKPDLLIPVTEKTLIPIEERRQRFESLTAVALPSRESLAVVLDKQATADLAVELEIPVPRSVTVSDGEGLAQAAREFGFPLVLKPIHSVSRQDGAIGPQLAVTYAFDAEEIERVAAPLLEHGAIVAQEYFRGEGCGVELIASQGEIHYAFQHRRCHELPLSGGGSCLREAVAVDPALREAATKMVRALNWQGVAMVEFKRAANGEFRLIEINGRFWGSLPLSVVAGADFPWLAWNLYTRGTLPTIPAYHQHVRCRDLAKDLYWHEYVLRRVTDPRLFAYPAKGRLVRELLGVLSPRHYFDSWRWFDPLPGLLELTRLARHYGERMTSILQSRRRLAQQRRAWTGGDIQRRLQSARTVLILCYGNINRSAAAHAYLRSRHDLPSTTVLSAGFHPIDARAADPNMVAAAAAQGVDMQEWRSCTVTASMLREADIIFVMELAHIDRVLELAPEVQERCYLWGSGLAASCGSIEIADPYGKPPAEYQACYRRLVAAADCLFGDAGGSSHPAPHG